MWFLGRVYGRTNINVESFRFACWYARKNSQIFDSQVLKLSTCVLEVQCCRCLVELEICTAFVGVCRHGRAVCGVGIGREAEELGVVLGKSSRLGEY